MSTETNIAETPASTTTASATPEPRFIIVSKGAKRVFLRWPDVAEYDALFVALNRHFPEIHPQYKNSYAIQTNDLAICDGIFVDIPGELWKEMSTKISRIRIMDKSVSRRLKFHQLLMNIAYWGGSTVACPYQISKVLSTTESK
ncbi:uncharacterized protein EV420DRAFT_1749498 [Desarmillaria tabescens]|uniref:Uncharacterized protein n=1 Tax=Armillaria tabescens TaxID=1929756 RepID=A0AA39K402_ARMTA|nr:uncharacterized protein EV420DRAFT_1749498 [Desarmillaria tabescens]KAK0454162.1 hypothetical protein EV420DRAFT_1749498 [Desarmillaria tabescens]